MCTWSAIEGLAFRRAADGSGAGTLYLVHQRRPAMVVVLRFDAASGGGWLGAEQVEARWPLDGYQEAKAITYVPALDRFLVVADAEDRLVVVSPDGGPERDLPLPGLQQEGVCLDADGALWIADDRGGELIRIPGGLDALR